VIDAIIFDLGNVLAFHDNAKLYRALAALFEVEPETLHAKLPQTVWDRVNRGQLRGDALRRELSRLLGHEPSREAFERAWSCHFTLNLPMVRIAEALVGKVPLVLLSNTHDLHVAHLKPQLPVLEKFEALVLSCEVGHIKPEPEIYALAVAAAKVPASRAVFFDDLEPYVDAARRFGLHAHVFRDASDVPRVLRELGADALVSAL
jgi:putative hydrolase of the HAD superfamily